MRSKHLPPWGTVLQIRLRSGGNPFCRSGLDSGGKGLLKLLSPCPGACLWMASCSEAGVACCPAPGAIPAGRGRGPRLCSAGRWAGRGCTSCSTKALWRCTWGWTSGATGCGTFLCPTSSPHSPPSAGGMVGRGAEGEKQPQNYLFPERGFWWQWGLSLCLASFVPLLVLRIDTGIPFAWLQLTGSFLPQQLPWFYSSWVTVWQIKSIWQCLH